MAIPKIVIKEVQKISADQYKIYQLQGISILAQWIAQKEKRNSALPRANTN